MPGPQSRRLLPPTGLPVDEVRQFLATGGIAVLDVRDESAFERGYLPGSLHAPESNPRRLVAEVTRHPRTVLVWETGKTSAMVARTLKFSGLADPCYFVGGIRAWTAQGLSLVQISETGQRHRTRTETFLGRTTRRIAPVARGLNSRMLFASLGGVTILLEITLALTWAGRIPY